MSGSAIWQPATSEERLLARLRQAEENVERLWEKNVALEAENALLKKQLVQMDTAMTVSLDAIIDNVQMTAGLDSSPTRQILRRMLLAAMHEML